MKDLIIKGAREHNLKNISLALKRNSLIVFTGLSGSGKSTLAFDTIYAEGQRRYVESLSSYARQFLGLMNKPAVDSIEGLSPAISIEQKTTSKNPRSTVGTVTEIYDYLRLLFARIGKQYDPETGVLVEKLTPESIAQKIIDEHSSSKEGFVLIFSPIVRQKKGTYEQLFKDLHKEGFSRVRVNGSIYKTTDSIPLDRYKKHSIDILIAKVSLENPSAITEAVELAIQRSKGLVYVNDTLYSTNMSENSSYVFEELEPRVFSFNSPFGACETCSGLGEQYNFDEKLIIPDESLSIADGAIALYRNAVDGWRGQHIAAVAKHYGFDIFTPISFLSEKHKSILFYGSKDAIRFDMNMKGGDTTWSSTGHFEGLIPQSERLYKQTESEYRRKELEKFMRVSPCPSCKGKRLQKKVLAVKIEGKSIIDVTDLSITQALTFFKKLKLSKKDAHIAEQILKELISRLTFLDQVGLSYLTLSRSAGTLSGGEAQRIRLATQIGSQLTGVLYILDEPSIGLHQRDNVKLIDTLVKLRDLGNTVIVVEHDEDTIRRADYVVDIGPGAGIHGGSIVAKGTPKQIETNSQSITGRFLSGKESIPTPLKRRYSQENITLKGVREHNLKNISVTFPVGCLTAVTGVSGSGKSTLVFDVLHKAIQKKLYGNYDYVGEHDFLDSADINKVIVIDQSPIGKTPRSNPATYTKVFDDIRFLFSQTKDAKLKGFSQGRFSFNVKGGRCEACQGDGTIKIEMNFLPDVYVPCEECKGKRYNKETLSVLYKGKSIADVLDLTVIEAYDFFKNVPQIKSKLQTLLDVGLSYISLGQNSVTLSGGEAQRIKLTRELAKRGTGKTLYLLDEPTTGLHFADVKKLIDVLQNLVDKGNTMIVIEHNLDVIKSADYIIDIGPEGGDAGGEIVSCGTPEDISQNKNSHTATYLRKVL